MTRDWEGATRAYNTDVSRFRHDAPLTQPPRRGDAAARSLLDGYRRRIDLASVYDVAVVSPLEAAPKLSARLGNHVWLKREDSQPVHSFKLRGAYNKMSRLTPAERKAGVVTASAGNHAQGVALAARKLGLTAVIVMPGTTPAIKVDAVRALGGKVVLDGDTYDESAAHARQLARDKGMTLVHPYDDPDVIAGQGTIGRELLEQAGDGLDAVFVPVGGGGLIAGIAASLKAARPSVRVIGVEPDDAACMTAALKAGRRVVLPQVGLFADGVAVKQAGAEPFRVARKLVDGMVTVSVDEICAAIRDVFVENRSLLEPAGALAVAGLKRWVHEGGARGRRLAAICSGANVNFDRLRHIAERAEIGDAHETLLAVTIPEKPGSFKRFLGSLGRRVVTEFNYRFSSPREAHIFVGLKLGEDGERERPAILRRLRRQGYPVVDLTGNEMAKVHVRYMVGGRAAGLRDEMLLRFEFPERPGAALEFLNALHGRWNISLFHYRNHGAAYGRVLCGLQVPARERAECRRALDALGYDYSVETGNPAYDLFLGTR
jgi:threonine dehydratase